MKFIALMPPFGKQSAGASLVLDVKAKVKTIHNLREQGGLNRDEFLDTLLMLAVHSESPMGSSSGSGAPSVTPNVTLHELTEMWFVSKEAVAVQIELEKIIKKRIDTNNVEFDVTLPPTTITKKYDLYLTLLRKNRRHNEEPRVISQENAAGVLTGNGNRP